MKSSNWKNSIVMIRSIFSVLSITLFIGCAQSQSPGTTSDQKVEKEEAADNGYVRAPGADTLQTAFFASGCFWCVEGIYESVEGVAEAEAGYAGGDKVDPTYTEVCSGTTGHAETIKVYYDSTVVSFGELVDVFFNSHDPTTLNQQGPDKGTQYRSIAFYQNAREKEIIEDKILTLLTEKVYGTITTEVKELDTFYVAEDYHQNFVERNQKHPYVNSVSKPRINKFKEKMPDVIEK